MTKSPQPWTLVLRGIVKSVAERKRLATVLGVSDMTLTRWANGKSNPQRQHLIWLVRALQPQHREEIVLALEKTYTEIRTWLKSDTDERVPSDFFASIFNLRTTITETSRFWNMSNNILTQALLQLDPNKVGLSVKLIRCMPPRDGKVRSIRECAGKGTPPWTADLEHDVLFLGLESMSGYATEVRHFVNDNDLREGKNVPAYQGEFEISALAQPILFKSKIAGCLLAASTQEAHFTQERVLLLEDFANLISLAFDEKDFYPRSMIELRFVPRPATQKPIIRTFRDRVRRKTYEARQKNVHLTNAEAELAVWQEIEGELLSLPYDESKAYNS